MKEYVAETGGRYTYAEDVLNLQELALSMAAIFEGCSDFIISGCEISGTTLSQGYVWLGGKVRYFEGATGVSFPYYIYEKNGEETVAYANEVNKCGRRTYLCAGSKTVPQVTDPMTGAFPRFIEVKADYSPRFIDKFFGRYALLVDSPFARQTVKKDLVLAGTFIAEKDIESKTAVSVVNAQNGYTLRNVVKTSGDASLGVYLGGLLVNEIVIATDGSFRFIKQGQELARVSEQGFSYTVSTSQSSRMGSISIFDDQIANTEADNDQGTVRVNFSGFQGGTTRFRDFAVYNGRGTGPILYIAGKTGAAYVNGVFSVRNAGEGMDICSAAYQKSDKRLISTINWKDNTGEAIAQAGYITADAFDFAVRNTLGNIVLSPQGYVNVVGELRVNGVSIASTYVTQTTFNAELAKKVTVITGKGLSTEDFTTELRQKLIAISSGGIESDSSGYVAGDDVAKALAKKLGIAANLSDLADKSAARTNLDVYSKSEAGGMFLKTSGKLLELVNLSAEEINGLTTEQASALKLQKQATVRDNIDAEKKGTGDLKLAKASNLSDLPDKPQARKNISVYSTVEIDGLLAQKLGIEAAYGGATFSDELLQKLINIKTGNFAYIDSEGKSHSQVEGYVTTSQVAGELTKKANLLMDGLNSAQKDTIAANLGVYTKTASDARYAQVETLFQDYITYLVKSGKTTAEAQKALRDKLDVLSKTEVSGTYVSRTGQLGDLALANADAKKLACRNIGAAYADEYQAKLVDTGWIQMSNSGTGTNTNAYFVRQIGNIVCIQGIINTARRDGSNWGGVVAVIPNQIQPPRYGIRQTMADWNDDHKYNRGSSFTIDAGSRQVRIYESGMYGSDVFLNFTYMV